MIVVTHARKYKPEKFKQNEDGFTLVEVLVALALIATIFALVTSAWVTMVGGQQRLERGITNLSEQVVRQNMMAATLAKAMAWPVRENAARQFVFEGKPDQFSIIVARPGFEPGSAFQLWQWRIEAARSHFVLSVQSSQFRAGMTLDDVQNLDDWRPFFTFQSEPHFDYLNLVEGRANWLRTWDDMQSLPKAVALVRSEGAPWVMPLRHELPAICAGQVDPENDLCG